jgi:murein DD-endopeptidase MepM/ murein hydrolase activator NlpD
MSPSYDDKNLKSGKIPGFNQRIKKILKSILGFFKKVGAFNRQKLTIMIIPHSEKKAINFRISFLSMAFMALGIAAIIGIFVYVVPKFSGMSNILENQTASLVASEENVEEFQDRIVELRKVNQEYIEDFEAILEVFGIKDSVARDYDETVGDRASFYSVQEREDGFLKELNELDDVGDTLKQSIAKLNQVAKNVSVYKGFLPLLPTLWPIEGDNGIVTGEFGPNIHPIRNILYLHKGIDLVYYRGADIRATADGKVIEAVRGHSDYGNYITIRHQYGFYTKYAHLDSIKVKEGDLVKQGQYIGDLGNTGLSTGPHLHYEIRIGSQVIDPRKFIFAQKNMK